MLRKCSLCLLLFIALGGCDNNASKHAGSAGASHRSLAEIKASGELRVLTRNAPTLYYIDRDAQPAGPAFDLTQSYARVLGVTPVYIVKATLGGVLQGLRDGEGDLAAAGLTILDDRRQEFLFSRPTLEVTQQVVCRRGGKVAKTPEQLADVSLEVVADSSYVATLTAMKQEMPELSWRVNGDTGTEPLLQKVWQKKIDCTIADSNIVAVNRRYLPELIVMFDLSETQQQAWSLPPGATELRNDINAWLRSDAGDLALTAVNDRYYSFIDQFDYVDTRALIRRIDQRLPRYESLFEKAATTHGIDEALLAAQAYQESHWNPKAKSPTGVRGIMMLTSNTAEALGVEDRTDPRQAIPAGARYLAKMRNRFVEDIPEPDRTYMALAAYNIGRAHMHDAQSLARRLDKDPHSWTDIREVLPLLSDKRYYKDLKYGYARGLEPVRYVQRIRNYHDILETKEAL